MRYFAIFLLNTVFIAALSGCGAAPVKPSDEVASADKAIAAFGAMKDAYVGRDAAAVTAFLSPEFKGGPAEFSGRARKDADAFDKVELDPVVERVEETKDTVRVVFHWRGKWHDRQGREFEGRGNCVFVFKDDGGMKLFEIVGDSPFDVIK